ncbi:MAG: class D sortase [Bryobacteraceae bacterium]
MRMRLQVNTGSYRQTARRILRIGEYLSLAIGLAALTSWTVIVVDAKWTQESLRRSLEELQEQSPMLEGSTAPRQQAPQSLVGQIEVARLGLSAMVLEGVDSRTLSRAVGHIPGTALPGSTGNVAFAGHRDTFFRGLKDIRLGDEIVVTTPYGRYQYRVFASEIVKPTETRVLAASAKATVTLVTCYPFHYIGSAPKRFIVHAHLVQG